MAVSGTGQNGNRSASEAAVRAILALLVEEREARLKERETKDATKIELVLSNAGLPVDEIVAVTGKKPDAVRKAIQRGKAK